jgi:hypothetical protein
MNKNFFDYYPDQIFSPLTGDNRRLNWSILLSLYHRFFDETAEYVDDDFSVSKIRRHIKGLLLSSKVTWVDEESGKKGDDENVDLEQRVYRCYQRLVDCGWLKIETRGHKDHVFMSPRIVELLQLLDTAGSDVSRHVGGSVLTVHSALERIIDEKSTATDVVVSLEQAVDESKNMTRRMNRLAMHLRDVSSKIAELPDAIQKAEAFFNNFINESSFVDYNDIKKKDHPMRFKYVILRRLDDLEFNHELKSRVLTSLEQDPSIGNHDKALLRLTESIGVIRRVFINTDNLLDRIDKTHSKLVHRFNEALRYRRRVGSDLKVHIEAALSQLKNHKSITSLSVVNTTPEMGGISGEHLYKIKRQKRQLDRQKSTAIREVSVKKKLRDKLHREFLMEMAVTQDRLNDWLGAYFEQADFLSSTDIDVETPEDFAMFIQSLRLCTDSAFLNKKFSEMLKHYEFSITGTDVIEHEAVYCRPFEISRHQDV